MLKKEQAEIIKKQLLIEIEKNFPEDKKEDIKNQIENMSSEELESFLKKNKLVKDESTCLFCSIINKEIPSYNLAENDSAVAVLEINPISKGHTLVIPKIHSEETEKKALDLAKEVSEAIKILKPKKIDIHPSRMFGHEILNVIPVFNDETIESPRIKVKENDLKSLQEKIKKAHEKIKEKHSEKEKPKVDSSKKEIISEINEKNTWLPRRIP
jgi:hypothetical protein